MSNSILAQRVLIVGNGEWWREDTPGNLDDGALNACRDIDIPQINPVCRYRWDCEYSSLYDSIKTG